MRAVHTVIGLSATVVLSVGCSATEPTTVPEGSGSPSDATANAVGPIPTGLEAFYTQGVEWEACDRYSTDGEELSSSVECAMVTVPLDYADPTGETIRVAISRSRAAGEKIGSVLMNPGGPGSSGLYLAEQADGTAIADRFDRIGFDPRGIGASEPQVRCLTPEEVDEERREPDVDVTPEGIAATEADHRDYAAQCVQRTGSDFLEHVGTREVVQDIDVIRAVLGDARLTFVGYSYGTRIGTAYAEKFPSTVRAMVLDGALDPEQSPVDEAVAQGAAFQMAFDQFAADCARTDTCPLGTDPAQAVGRFRALVDPLVDRLAETTDPRGLSYDDAITGVQQALYSQQLWRLLRAGLNELGEGRGDTLLRLADTYSGRLEDGSYTNIDDAFNAIRCVDGPPTTDRSAADEADARFRAAAPYLDDGRATGNAPLDLCAFWPVPNTSDPHEVTAEDLPTLVVVSTTRDPATPYEAGVTLAAQLGADLVTYDGTQHTVAFSGVQCIDDPLIDYLVDLTAPGPDLEC